MANHVDDDFIEAKDLEPSQKTARGVFYALIVLCSIIYTLTVMPTAEYFNKIQSEADALAQITTDEEMHSVTERAGKWYRYIVVESGFQDMLRRLFDKEPEQEKLKFGFKEITDRLANNTPVMIYQATFK